MDSAGCFGKLPYATMAQAKDAMRALRSKPSFHNGSKMDVYGCARCGQFHIGRDSRSGPSSVKRSKHGEREIMSKLARYYQLVNGTKNR